MKKTKLLIIIGIVLSGCGNYVYRPVTVKPQFFEKKGDMEASINTAGMTEIHGAYAFHKSFSAGLTYSFANQSDSTYIMDTSSVYSKYGYTKTKYKDFEISGCYFKKMGTSGVFEVQAGLGLTGRSFESFKLDNTRIEFNKSNPYTRFFVQPAFGINGQVFDIGIAARMQLIKYPIVTDFLIEPTLFTRFGYKNVKAMFQLGLLAASKHGNYDYWPLNIGFGLYFQMNNSTKAKKK